jgi:hypothetical protein
MLLCAALAGAVPALSTAATIGITSRDTLLTLSFADQSAFSDASLASKTTLGLIGVAGDTRNFGWLVPTGTTNFSVQTSEPDFSVSSGPTLNAGSPNSTYGFVVAANANPFPVPGTLTVTSNLGVNVAPAGAISSISTGANNSFLYLDQYYNPEGNQSVGAPFSVTVRIPGDYSAATKHELLSLGAAWTTGSNFVYDSGNNVTIFSASIQNYQGQSSTPLNLEYRIYGAPVPEPATVWLLAAGVAGLGWAGVRRRRNRGHAA